MRLFAPPLDQLLLESGTLRVPNRQAQLDLLVEALDGVQHIARNRRGRGIDTAPNEPDQEGHHQDRSHRLPGPYPPPAGMDLGPDLLFELTRETHGRQRTEKLVLAGENVRGRLAGGTAVQVELDLRLLIGVQVAVGCQPKGYLAAVHLLSSS